MGFIVYLIVGGLSGWLAGLVIGKELPAILLPFTLITLMAELVGRHPLVS